VDSFTSPPHFTTCSMTAVAEQGKESSFVRDLSDDQRPKSINGTRRARKLMRRVASHNDRIKAPASRLISAPVAREDADCWSQSEVYPFAIVAFHNSIVGKVASRKSYYKADLFARDVDEDLDTLTAFITSHSAPALPPALSPEMATVEKAEEALGESATAQDDGKERSLRTPCFPRRRQPSTSNWRSMRRAHRSA